MDFEKIFFFAFTGFIGFAGAWGGFKVQIINIANQIKEIHILIDRHVKERNETIKAYNSIIHNRIDKANDNIAEQAKKTEQIKDAFTSDLNEMKIKLTEIHTIVTQKK